MLTWGQNLLEPRIGGTDFTIRMIDRPKLSNGKMSCYTRGLVMGSHRNEDYFGHTGGYYAYTGLFVFPSMDLVIAFAGNRNDIAPIETTLRIFDAFYPDYLVKTPGPIIAFIDGSTDKKLLNRIWVNPDTGLVFDATSRGGVILLNHGGKSAYLSPAGNNTFVAGLGGHSAKIIIDQDNTKVNADLYDGVMRIFKPILPQPAECKEFAALTGSYYSDETGAVLEIISKNKHLIMNIADLPTPDFEFKLMRLLPNVLLADHMSLMIDNFKAREIQSFLLHTHGAHNIRYRRIGMIH
jgi:hypothetical protein